MTPVHEDFERRLAEALREEASVAMTMTDTPRELRRWKDNQKRRRFAVRITAAAAIAAAVAGIIVGVTLLGSGSSSSPQPMHHPKTPVITSTFGMAPALPRTTVVKSVHGPVNVGAVAFGAVWETGFGPTAGHLYRLDPTSGDVLSESRFTGPVGDGAPPLRAGGVMLLPTQPKHGRSGYLVYGSNGYPTGGFIPASNPTLGAGTSTGAWVSLTNTTIGRVDATGRLVQHVRVPGGQLSAIGFGGGGLWVASISGDVVRIDPGTGTVLARVTTDTYAIQIVVGTNAAYASTADFKVLRIDSSSDHVTAAATARFGAHSYVSLDLAPDGRLWTSPDQGGIVVLDPTTLRVTGGMQVYPDTRNGGVSGLSVAGKRVFLGDVDQVRTVTFTVH